MASPGHGRVELRIIGMGEGSDRNADNDLVDGFALGGVRCDANALIDVKCAPGDYLACFDRNLAVLDSGHGEQLVVTKPAARALKVLTDSNPITRCDFDLFPFVKIKLGRA